MTCVARFGFQSYSFLPRELIVSHAAYTQLSEYFKTKNQERINSHNSTSFTVWIDYLEKETATTFTVKLFRAKKKFEELLIQANKPHIEAMEELKKFGRKLFGL